MEADFLIAKIGTVTGLPETTTRLFVAENEEISTPTSCMRALNQPTT